MSRWAAAAAAGGAALRAARLPPTNILAVALPAAAGGGQGGPPDIPTPEGLPGPIMSLWRVLRAGGGSCVGPPDSIHERRPRHGDGGVLLMSFVRFEAV